MPSIRYPARITQAIATFCLFMFFAASAAAQDLPFLQSAKKNGIVFSKPVELKFELKAQGPFPNQDKLIAALQGLGFKTSHSVTSQNSTVDGKQVSAAQSVSIEAERMGLISESEIEKIIAEVQSKAKSKSGLKWSISQVR